MFKFRTQQFRLIANSISSGSHLEYFRSCGYSVFSATYECINRNYLNWENPKWQSSYGIPEFCFLFDNRCNKLGLLTSTIMPVPTRKLEPRLDIHISCCKSGARIL